MVRKINNNSNNVCTCALDLVSKEPTGIYCDGGVKRPDGVTLVPRQSGRTVAWDITVARWQIPSFQLLV